MAALPRKKEKLQGTPQLEKTVSAQLAKLLHFKAGHIHSEMDRVRYIRNGLPFQTLEELSLELGLTQQDLSETVGLNIRTLARRKKEKKLDLRESDRIYRLAWIYALAMVVLENKIFALKWLTTPKIALGGEIPLKLLDTEIGTREVERVLGCIEYGIYT